MYLNFCEKFKQKWKVFFIFILIFLFIIPIAYSIETVQTDTKGVTVEMSEKNVINLEIVESSSLRIGNSREDSTEIYKITALDIGNVSITLRIGKRDNATVSLGQERKYDFDKDNVFDAGILLSNLRPGRATLIFKSLEGKIESLEINNTPSNISNEEGFNEYESKKINESKLTVKVDDSSETKNEEVELVIDSNIFNKEEVSDNKFKIISDNKMIIIIILAIVFLGLVFFLIYKRIVD